MLPLDPWSRAAECDRAIELVADPERRIVLDSLRSVWVALCNEHSFLYEADRSSQFSNLAQIHTELMAVCRNGMH
jgi:hypothetical protein